MIDFSLSDKITDDIVINNDLLLVLQQIDLLFNTDPYDVLGDMNFGSNYDDYLYTVGVSNIALENKILTDINKLDLLGYRVDVKVTLVEGTERDIAFIDITVSGDLETESKTYVIN